jgi:hypothetical protein
MGQIACCEPILQLLMSSGQRAYDMGPQFQRDCLFVLITDSTSDINIGLMTMQRLCSARIGLPVTPANVLRIRIKTS